MRLLVVRRKSSVFLAIRSSVLGTILTAAWNPRTETSPAHSRIHHCLSRDQQAAGTCARQPVNRLDRRLAHFRSLLCVSGLKGCSLGSISRRSTSVLRKVISSCNAVSQTSTNHDLGLPSHQRVGLLRFHPATQIYRPSTTSEYGIRR